MNIFEKPDETTRGNIKGFSEIGSKIRRAEGDRVKAKLLRQSRLPVNHTGCTSFSCIFAFTRHRLDEINAF